MTIRNGFFLGGVVFLASCATPSPPPPEFSGKNDVALYEIAQRSAASAEQILTAFNRLVPPGAIMASTEPCDGLVWIRYEEAEGRFLRGIDPTGNVDPEKNRQPGKIQDEDVGKHVHPISIAPDADGHASALAHAGGGSQRSHVSPAYPMGWVEGMSDDELAELAEKQDNRPDNVAVYFCKRVPISFPIKVLKQDDDQEQLFE